MYCKKDKIIRYGWRTTKERGKIQRYQCKSCRKTFCQDDGFRWKHKSKETIINALELYVGGGTTLRFLSRFMGLSTDTILRWLNEYCRMICRFVKRFKPQIIDKINIDELFLKMKKTFYYLWDAVCSDSKFAFFFFSDRRDNKSAEELIKQFINAFFMIFDGAFAYPTIIKKLKGVDWYYHHTHRCKDFEDKKNNNPAERLQNFVRSLTHQRRGFKSLEGGRTHFGLLFIYYNFVRIHSAIKTTPAEKAGLIEYLGAETENKRWEFLIKEGSRIILLFYQPYFATLPGPIG